MKFAFNLAAANPLLIIGIVALVVIGVAVIAFVLIYTRKMSKKNTVAEKKELHAAQPSAAEVPSTDAVNGKEEDIDESIVSVGDDIARLEKEMDIIGEQLLEAETELAEKPAEVHEEEAYEEPAAEEEPEVAEEVTEAAPEEVAPEEVSAVEEIAVAEEPAPEEVKEEAATEEPAPVKAESKPSAKINIRVSYNRSFTAKLIQSDDTLKDYYSDIKNELLSYKKVKSRISWRYETFRKGRKLLAKFALRGKTLNFYLALNPADYEGTKYKIKDVSAVACNASVPSLYKIKNERRRRYAKQLIADLMKAEGIEAGERPETDYAAEYPYEEIEQLIDKNLVKLVPWKEFSFGSEVGVISVNEEDITEEIAAAIVTDETPVTAQEELAEEEAAEEAYEEPAEEEAIEEEAEPEAAPEAVTEEVAVTEETTEEPAATENAGVIRIRVRYNRSFTAKLIQSDDTVKSYYEQIKNELLRYKKVKSRISWRQETFRRGRKLLARIQIRGKTLSVYFALNPADYADTKYKVQDVSSVARNAEVPALYKIKNDRRCRYAKDLIADLMAANGVEAGLEVHEDYVSQYPYEEIEPLIDRNLVKLVPWKEFVTGSEVGEITVREEDITEEIAAAIVTEETPVPAEEEVEEEVENTELPEEDDYVEDSVKQFFDEEETEEDTPAEESAPEAPATDMSINVVEADEILDDRYVESFVRQSAKYSDKTKKAVINIDTLGRYFNAGETVTVEEIKKRVPEINKKVTYIKVLARGKLDKALTVEADDFSPQAIKMIVLTGGSVVRNK